MFKNIAVSISVLKTSAIIIIRNLRMLLMPLIEAIVLTLWIGLWLYGFFHLASSGTIEAQKQTQFKKIELT
jgi:hypothetical protein